ncbi:MAG TPA: aminotransferase class V-fold PLP-dependent enzyme [candidate division Zixibacteria bacterium]|nr:aminotransferase class V-fold PLP-dependent enzyme [candidate division Zixibacteria bacterium]
MEDIYLDNNATTKIDDRVFVAMRPYLTSHFAHPSSMHSLGARVRQKMEQARDSVAALLGTAHPDEVVFTSGGTESINTAIQGVLSVLPTRNHIVTTRVEHVAVIAVCERERGRHRRVTYLRVDREGMLDIDELRQSLTDDTAIVSVMWANNETGVIFPVEEIGEMVKERGIAFHVDAVQAVGRVPINLRKLAQIDLLSLSAHKFHGPKGVGALFVRRGTKLRSLIAGGPQEGLRRAGTENVAAIIGMGKAAELASIHLEEENTRVRRLRDKLEKGIRERVPGTKINGNPACRLPNTTNVTFCGLEAERLLREIERRGIYASSGAASSGRGSPSHVLTAMGLTPREALSSIRFALSRFNTEEEIDYATSVVAASARNLKADVAASSPSATGV